MRIRDCLLPRALRAPEETVHWGLEQWDLLIRQARGSELLPRLAHLLQVHGQWEALPQGPRRHLQAGLVLADKQVQAVRWELSCISQAFAASGIPVVLLKGAAYLAADLPAARGRLFSDIDLMVPKASLAAAEAALMRAGWAGSHHSAYDQRYYRRWMHEIPPMRHIKRQSVIDLHHAILPETARLRTDSSRILAAAQPLPTLPVLRAPRQEDLVLHSAVHLFQEGEFPHGLRDIVDLDALLRHFGEDPAFWARLDARARELALTRPWHYAAHFCRDILDTPIPALPCERAGRPAALPRRAMQALLARVLAPHHDSCADAWSGLARGLLFVRGHWLRMPLHLLLPHLFYKAFIAPRLDQQEA